MKEDLKRSHASLRVPLTEITDIVAGANFTLILVKNHETNKSEIYAFGHEISLVGNESTHSHIPLQIVIQKAKEHDVLDKIYAKNNTSMAIYRSGKTFMWGENSFNMRLRKPKAFHHFKGGVK